jgi:competence protein ComEA
MVNKNCGVGIASLILLGGLTFAATRASAPHPFEAVTDVTTKTNLNRASIVDLETLPGVGPKIAVEIVQHRPYRSGEELMVAVKSMSLTLWEHLKSKVTF